MIIVKYTLLLIIFTGATFLGNLISKKYKNRVEELKNFKCYSSAKINFNRSNKRTNEIISFNI